MAKLTRPPTQSVAAQLIEWLSDGKTLRAFCRQPRYPSKSAIYRLIEGDAELAGLIARAREEGHDAIADECLEIIDSATDANLGKAQVWTRLQLLAKWNPKKYGDKLGLTGGDGSGPIQAAITVEFVKPKQD